MGNINTHNYPVASVRVILCEMCVYSMPWAAHVGQNGIILTPMSLHGCILIDYHQCFFPSIVGKCILEDLVNFCVKDSKVILKSFHSQYCFFFHSFY